MGSHFDWSPARAIQARMTKVLALTRRVPAVIAALILVDRID